MDRQDAISTINALYAKYEKNPFMLAKTHNYIVNQLPSILENINTVHIERQNRIEELTQTQYQFIESFLSPNQYFYNSTTENFFLYDGITYQLYNEDDILYHILSTISKEKELATWKQSTKNAIMKRIRENSLIKTIPESETIQLVLDSLCPVLFTNRSEAKYFLTILGDNILRKNPEIIHYIDVKSKHFIRNFNNFCQMWIGQSFYQTFKHKYHDHDYNDCRIITINDFVKSDLVYNSIITQNGLNIICVACHYSERYGSSDTYVNNYSNDNDLMNNVFYLKNHQQPDIIDKFLSEFLEIENNNQNNGTQITWRDMQYLWKNFLESKKLPSIMFLQTLKTNLVSKLSCYYNEQADSFIGICSKHLPEIQKFLSFWEETVVVDENECDFEIEEIIVLFRMWCVTNKEMTTNLNDKQILDLIAYFYPNIDIDDDKYIQKIKNTMWDKQITIQIALDNIKNSNPCSRNNTSIYDAYKYYCKFSSNMDNTATKLIVSKSFFEKYVFDNLSQYIIDSKFISYEWFSN